MCFSLPKDPENYPVSFLENNLYPNSFYFPLNFTLKILPTLSSCLLNLLRKLFIPLPYSILLVSQCNYVKNTYNKKNPKDLGFYCSLTF